MADVEQLQIIVVELRKFRKKLRQIEKLEELERDLTEEEILKVANSSLWRIILYVSSTTLSKQLTCFVRKSHFQQKGTLRLLEQ